MGAARAAPALYPSGVFERFTERARQVVVLAQGEARALKHNYIGTEHLLLGLLREEEGLAAHVLESLDITVEEVRAQVAWTVGQGEEATTGQIPFTPRAKKVLELSLREALSLGHNYVGTEHLLLGLVREDDGVAAHILRDRFDADAEKIRSEIIRMLSGRSGRLANEIAEAHRKRDEAIEAADFEQAVHWREVERKLRREPGATAGVSVSSVRRGTRTLDPTRKAPVWEQWPSMLTGAALLGLGILIGRLIWG
jgi:ATP-dependent Clp protease ATP-binding subunit ClpA